MSALRSVPKVDRVMEALRELPGSERDRRLAARWAVDQARERAKAGQEQDFSIVVAEAKEALDRQTQPALRHAINGTGVVLHTGLGRAVLAPEAREAILRIADAHTNLEIDLDSGKRGDRQAHVRGLLQELTGAADALVVNNCAAAVVLTLAALAAGREVVLSRGQMVEIGGAFRMPDIVRQSGCGLVEVGCTNKTRLSDFEEVTREQTAAYLRCHRSNFALIGFSEEPSARELAELARLRGVLLLDDVGSGCLIDTTQYGLPRERTLREALADGADVVMASGDKLLGGPQAGLILGTQAVIAKIRRHPLARAARIDKFSLAALEATLLLYAEGRHERVPVWGFLARSMAEVQRAAKRLAAESRGRATVERSLTEVGGGSMPGSGVPTWVVRLRADDPEALAKAWRARPKPIFGRIEGGDLLIDPRTMSESDLTSVRMAIRELGG